ncbi:hypothetical protein ACLKA7_014037 [Drosophila subpalustris]
MKNLATPSILYSSFILWHFISNVFGQSNECVNCSAYNKGCEITRTGWSAFKYSTRDQQLVVKIPQFNDESEYDIVLDESLTNCTLDGYTITDTLETFVCFWSPLLGFLLNSINNGHFSNYCPNCSQWIDPDCLPDESGFIVAKFEDDPKLEHLNDGEEVDPSIAKCVDDTFKITGNLVLYIIFMSEKRGCLESWIRMRL